MPIGAEPSAEGGVSFRVWAPDHRALHVVLDDVGAVPLEREAGGYFHGTVPDARPGSLYRFRLDGGELLPDPASRFQPEGPFGPSEVVDPAAFEWSDEEWKGVEPPDRVLYEMHVGTFTPEGTWHSASERLEFLAELGVTLLQIMPVWEFQGRFGWGYDGVLPYAPTHLYGRADDFRIFVDRAHQLGMGVLLDVVYNHIGTVGNHFSRFARNYLSHRHGTAWGPSFNFDEEGREGVREYVVENGAYWIREYHLDGFRFDAVDETRDTSASHVLKDLVERARAATPRRLFLTGESQARNVGLIRPDTGSGDGAEPGPLLDALYDEDFHHTVHVIATGRAEAYRSDFRGVAQEMVTLGTRGPLYRGQWSTWEEAPLGVAGDLPASALVRFIQNHDQVANSVHGRRLHQQVGDRAFRAATAFLLLAPGVPMLFQGQESAAPTPFHYFADSRKEEREVVRQGRARSLSEFPGLASPEARTSLPDPGDPDTFVRSKLDPEGGGARPEVVRLHQDLLRLRRETPALREAGFDSVEGAVLGPACFVLLFRHDRAADHRLLLVNHGADLGPFPISEPLLAPLPGFRWERRWHTELPRYGGEGLGPMLFPNGLHVPARCAVLFVPEARGAHDPGSAFAGPASGLLQADDPPGRES